MKKFKQKRNPAKVNKAESFAYKQSIHGGESQSRALGPQQGWLKEIWNKWPGGESIEELLAALDDH